MPAPGLILTNDKRYACSLFGHDLSRQVAFSGIICPPFVNTLCTLYEVLPNMPLTEIFHRLARPEKMVRVPSE
jgi:hypothetical protein